MDGWMYICVWGYVEYHVYKIHREQLKDNLSKVYVNCTKGKVFYSYSECNGNISCSDIFIVLKIKKKINLRRLKCSSILF